MNKLRELRRRKYSQAEVADLLGVSRSTYAKYETGDIQLGEEMLQKIADLYHVSVDFILGRPVFVPTETDLSEIDFALNGEIRALTENEKRDILDYIQFKRQQKAKRKK